MDRLPTCLTCLRFGQPLAAATSLALLLSLAEPAAARVVRIVIDDVKPLVTAPGQTIAYEQIAGRAFGELDPRAPLNAIIQDIELGKDADGKLRYTASFVLTRPRTTVLLGGTKRSGAKSPERASSYSRK